MRTLIINSKWRWIIVPMLTTVVSFAGLLLLNASGPPSGKLAQPSQTIAAPADRPATHIVNAPTAATFSAPIQLVRPISPIFFQQGGEPEIKVDIFGNIYATAIQGVPGGVDLWKSVDKGVTFTYLGQPDGAQDHCPTLPQCAGLGGGDDQIDVSTGGYLYISSLWAGSVTVSTSYDGALGGVQPGQAWQVHPAAASPGVPDDRQWVAAYGPETLYMTYASASFINPPGVIGLFSVKSTDGGKTFSAPTEITGITALNSVDVEGNLVVDPFNGNLYTAYVPNPGSNIINLARSTNGGNAWTVVTAYTGPAGTDNRGVFPVLAIDRGGNLHLVFTRVTTATQAAHVFMTSTANPAAATPTWTGAVQVDSGSGNTTTAVEPWVVAGSPGYVNITWLGTAAANHNVAADWFVFFAQTTNALSGSPVFNQSQVTASRVHDHSICFNGGGCTANPSGEPQNRDLLEYYTITLDPDGNANIVYADSVTNCPADVCITNAWVTRQTSGPTAYAPPAAPAPATFSANIGVGSPGAEPSIWVDSYNCIYVTAPGQPWVWKSVDNGASFLPPTNPVADEATLTGGDEDIVTLPRPDGLRPDQVYFADLGLSTVHIRKSNMEISATNHNPVWIKPGPGGAGGDTAVSSDRQWLAVDKGAPTATDQILYEWDHELASEIMRMSAMVNDTTWATQSGMGALSDPELATTVPNTNPGPVFVDKATHRVYGLFNASVPITNANNPPFGKLLNVWEADGPPPVAAGAPPGAFDNHVVHKGVYDSPNNPPPAVGPPVGPTFGTNNANIFPAGDIDSNGNIYVAWSMNNSRTNEFSIWFAASHDHGKTYYGPFPVSTGPMTADETAVFPWVVAGDNGRVDIIWYATTAVGDPNTITGSPAWKLYFAQSLNAASRQPVFTVVQPNPSNIIHNGQISTGGLLGSSDRSLLDFMEIAAGPDGLANIIFADNAGQGTRAEFTRQTSGPVLKTSPTSPSCLPGPPVPTIVQSRKTHGTEGDFNITLPLTAPFGVECRTGQPGTDQHKVVFTFAVPVTLSGASISSGSGSVQSATVSGNTVTVNLTAANNQKIVIKLTAVNDGAGNSGDIFWPMEILLGDVNATRRTDAGDVTLVRQQTPSTPASLPSWDFRRDVTASGRIDAGDVTLVRQHVPSALP
jgi:hypothetical protein